MCVKQYTLVARKVRMRTCVNVCVCVCSVCSVSARARVHAVAHVSVCVLGGGSCHGEKIKRAGKRWLGRKGWGMKCSGQTGQNISGQLCKPSFFSFFFNIFTATSNARPFCTAPINHHHHPSSLPKLFLFF